MRQTATQPIATSDSLIGERRFCGCTDNNACVDAWTGGTCAWITDDICSFCVEMDATADFVLYARFCHEMAQQLPSFTAEQHAFAAVAYREACI